MHTVDSHSHAGVLLHPFLALNANAQDSTAAALFSMLDSNHNDVISKMELISFCSSESVSVAKLTTALG